MQGIIIVGDIDVDKVEAKIKALFSPIKMPENAAKYEHYPVPDNNEPIYVIDKDKEQGQAIIQLMFKHQPLVPDEYKNTVAFLSVQYIKSLASNVFNARLNEAAQKGDCPFVAAYADDDSYILSKTMDAFNLVIIPKPGKDKEAIEAVMTEVKRVHEFGFTATEVMRASEEILSGLEATYNNRDKQKNAFYVPQYVRNFLENDPIPSIEDEYNMYKMMSQQMMQAQAAAPAASSFFNELTARTDTNFVCMAMYPEKKVW